MRFESEDDLRAWLHGHGIDTSTWVKTVRDLWKEYVNGETVFDDNPPARATSVVRVLIRQGDRVLFEVGQVFDGGGRRERNALPSEKMKPGETVAQAAVRCVREELGVVVPETAARPDETAMVEVESSPSYAGLPTRYTFYNCEVDVPGLPEGPFPTREDGDAVRTHHWEWRGGTHKE
jgi:hypothetical protein